MNHEPTNAQTEGADTAQLHIACPHCAAVNRIPAQRLRDDPVCGQCKRWLFVGTPTALTAQTFPAHAERSDLPLLIDFWAGWCQPCLMMAPQFAAAAGALEPALRLAKVDTEAEPTLAARFGIRSIPTMVLLHRGRELARHSGLMQAPQIVAWTRQQLGGR
jgi:thioredoxin 2